MRYGWPTILESDASAYAYASVISQRNPETGEVRPVVFHSSKFKDAEKRWPIRDKELYAIVNAFNEFRHFLQDNSAGPIQVYTDHRTLATCMDITTKLTPRLARWMEKLSELDFIIEYRPGETMVVPDAMTRRTQDGFEDKFGESQALLPRESFDPQALEGIEEDKASCPVEHHDWCGHDHTVTGEPTTSSPQTEVPEPRKGRNFANMYHVRAEPPSDPTDLASQ